MEQPKLNTQKTACTIGDQTIEANQTLDYKSASEPARVSIGRVMQFKYAGYKQCDETSVWMLVADMGKNSDTEWVSVAVWYEQFMSGMFATAPRKEDAPVTKKLNTENYDSSEPTDEPDYPF